MRKSIMNGIRRASNYKADKKYAKGNKAEKEQLNDLIERLPGISRSKDFSFAKLNKVAIQTLKDLTNLIDDMKGNTVPRHEMLFTLHKIVENISAVVDINTDKVEDTESEEEEEETDVPEEIQQWIHTTFTTQNEGDKKSGKLSLRRPSHYFKSLIGYSKPKSSQKFEMVLHDPLLEIQREALEILDKDLLWQFDVFELENICGEQTLKVLINYLFKKYNLFNKLKIPSQQFISLMNNIAFGYERYNNPYHNTLHGADVLQSLHALLSVNGFLFFLTPLELFTSFFAAAIHDFDHQGVTNNFIVDNKYPLALTYNDFAVQENHHVSEVFKLLRKPLLNIAINMSSEDFSEFRSLCIKMVLSTDMSQHFIQIKKCSSYIQSKDVLKMNDYLAVVLHTADLSNPAKEWKLHVRWVVHLFREFFAQGDRERTLGSNISPLCDRNSTLIFQSQIGFIDFIIQPTFDIFSNMTEIILSQYNDKSKGTIIKSKKNRSALSNLIIQFKFCNNRPWDICIMQNRTNWKRKGDKDYNETKKLMEDGTINLPYILSTTAMSSVTRPSV